MTILMAFLAWTVGATTLRSEDCHVYVHEQSYGQDVYGHWGWTTFGPALSATMELTTDRDFTFVNKPLSMIASLSVEGGKARVHVVAPRVNDIQKVDIRRDDYGSEIAQYATEMHDEDAREGMLYRVEYNLGLTAIVEEIKARDEAEMQRLGPPREWSDPQAPSVADLKIGTVLELVRDLVVTPGTDRAETFFVEQNGLVTQGKFWGLRLPFRFAYATFFNANNGYIEPAYYAQGMRLRLEKIERQDYSSGGHEFNLRFKTLTEGVVDPITWMKVVGRRSGGSDMRIPQLAELLASGFKIVEP